jgi:hypothetical protein
VHISYKCVANKADIDQQIRTMRKEKRRIFNPRNPQRNEPRKKKARTEEIIGEVPGLQVQEVVLMSERENSKKAEKRKAGQTNIRDFCVRQEKIAKRQGTITSIQKNIPSHDVVPPPTPTNTALPVSEGSNVRKVRNLLLVQPQTHRKKPVENCPPGCLKERKI